MYKILCNHIEYQVENVQDVISFVNKKTIAMEKNNDSQMVIIKSDKTKDYIEIGLGLSEKSLLFFVPSSESEDCRISCCDNQALIDSKNDITLTTFEGDTFYCSRFNLIDYYQALEVLKYYLNSKKLSKQIKWYAY